MRNEIDAAAKFLANLLRLHTNILSVEQLARFQETIEAHLADHYVDHWFPEKPNKGSAYRCIRINHKMDPIISKAGSKCGLDQKQLRTIFPNELTLWIDPKEVSYRIGENGSICVLLDEAKAANRTAADKGTNNVSSGASNTGTKNGLKTNIYSQSNHQQQRPNNRSSPTETSSLSSTTSTMSSPSPSSSPDWCRNQLANGLSVHNGSNDHHHQQQQQQQQQQHHHQAQRRSSPISGYQQQQQQHGGGFSSHGMQDLFGSAQQQSNGFVFNSGVVNNSSRNSGSHHFGGFNGGNQHHQQQQSTWGSPSRVDSPNWHNYSQHGTPVGRRSTHQMNHHGHSPVSHQQGFSGGWGDSQQVSSHQQHGHSPNHGGWFEQSSRGHSLHPSHHSHMNVNANLEQVAAYVSS